MKKKYLLDLDKDELEKEVTELGLPVYRSRQILTWVYQKRAEKFSDFSNLSSDLRNTLDRHFTLRRLKLKDKNISAIDGTIRYNFVTYDGYKLPCVFIPSKTRSTFCISTQIGCPIGCSFCRSGKVRFKRNLSRGEILEQIFQVEKDTEKKANSVLLMGMGEPLLNYDNVVSALKSLTDFAQIGLGRRHITISTIGYVPQIRSLQKERLGVRLALSLHAPDDSMRTRLIPGKVNFPIKDILNAGLDYSRQDRNRLTIEYMLIKNVNDGVVYAKKLAKLINKVSHANDNVQVNLIPYNPSEAAKWESPDNEAVRMFKNELIDNGLLVHIRLAKGLDIGSACGQLEG